MNYSEGKEENNSKQAIKTRKQTQLEKKKITWCEEKKTEKLQNRKRTKQKTDEILKEGNIWTDNEEKEKKKRWIFRDMKIRKKAKKRKSRDAEPR